MFTIVGRVLRTALLVVAALWVVPASLTARDLEIYIVDVEGGKCVLLVSPSGQSMLFDAGWPALGNRPASTQRILEALKAAKLEKIDFLVISHFDVDHLGDVPALAAKFPIGHVFDHGGSQSDPRFSAYAAVRDHIGHTVLKPGDMVPFADVDIQVLSAGGQLVQKRGTSNPTCASYQQAQVLSSDAEDDRSVGLLITFGRFRMLDLADLEAHYTHDLVCPADKIGPVSVYNVNVHGQFKGVAPELGAVLKAPVIIQANGARKGADALSWPVLKNSPGLQDIWQLHTSLNAGESSNPPHDFIANLEPGDGFHWLKISAARDGAFTVTNTRNGFQKTYHP